MDIQELKDFLSLKISLEESLKSREEEGVSRDHEEEKGGKKGRTQTALC